MCIAIKHPVPLCQTGLSRHLKFLTSGHPDAQLSSNVNVNRYNTFQVIGLTNWDRRIDGQMHDCNAATAFGGGVEIVHIRDRQLCLRLIIKS